ncbi:hypothetical protein KY284_026687 [Solanum tuberosum]|nr:hypothetical protein KY284_026687 [Solanum tuberosum]
MGGGGIETEGGDGEGSIVWCVRCEFFGKDEGVASLVGQPEEKGLEVDEKKKHGIVDYLMSLELGASGIGHLCWSGHR